MAGASNRRDNIRAAVEREGYVSLSSLSEEFGVAPVTIHRDLDRLEEEGVLERIHGGARSIRGYESIRTDFGTREAQMRAEKDAIARRALAEIPDGATVFLDASSTALALAPYLEREPARGLTVVTNSPTLASRLVAPLIHLIVLPGEVNQSLRAITGRWTVEFIEDLSFNVAIVSAAGLTVEGGLMTTQRELAEVVKASFARSRRRIALIDSSKFGLPALMSMAPKEQIDLVISDTGLPQREIAAFHAAGYGLVTAEEG